MLEAQALGTRVLKAFFIKKSGRNLNYFLSNKIIYII